MIHSKLIYDTLYLQFQSQLTDPICKRNEFNITTCKRKKNWSLLLKMCDNTPARTFINYFILPKVNYDYTKLQSAKIFTCKIYCFDLILQLFLVSRLVTLISLLLYYRCHQQITSQQYLCLTFVFYFQKNNNTYKILHKRCRFQPHQICCISIKTELIELCTNNSILKSCRTIFQFLLDSTLNKFLYK
eukprot:TRINITY_DN3400_c0_g1_i5.p1 TRINITY_DN3400_c0_g1~~TRINITY_DN3400_c0_g1_i5.p1  ORF type:complete len:188 (+),score=-26.03 TRINITY_DN3400_c0_g1_i5:152-715(+)